MVRAGQAAWPRDCPFSEAELRREIRALYDLATTLGRRARELHASLPEPPDDELYAVVPGSVYDSLHFAAAHLVEHGCRDWGRIEEKLAETPEDRRLDWLEYHLGKSVGRLDDFVRGRDPLARRLARALCCAGSAGVESAPKKEEDAA